MTKADKAEWKCQRTEDQRNQRRCHQEAARIMIFEDHMPQQLPTKIAQQQKLIKRRQEHQRFCRLA